MTRQRRGRRPEDQREGADPSAQPRVGPDGRPDERGPIFSPPNRAPTRTPALHPYTFGSTTRAANAAAALPTPVSRWSAAGSGARAQRARGAVPPASLPARGTTSTAAERRALDPSAGPHHRPTARAARSTPFELFCAYHLGITSDGGYRIQNIHEVARRFGANAAELRQILADLGMAADDIVHSGFDLRAPRSTSWSPPRASAGAEHRSAALRGVSRYPQTDRVIGRARWRIAQRQIDETIGRDGRWSPAPRDPAGKQS